MGEQKAKMEFLILARVLVVEGPRDYEEKATVAKQIVVDKDSGILELFGTTSDDKLTYPRGSWHRIITERMSWDEAKQYVADRKRFVYSLIDFCRDDDASQKSQ